MALTQPSDRTKVVKGEHSFFSVVAEGIVRIKSF